MVIENRLPKKQEAHDAANIVGFISIRMEVIGQCRRHQTSTLPSNYADVGKRLNPSPLQGGASGLRGFESRRRFHFNLNPDHGANRNRGRTHHSRSCNER